MPVLGIQVSLSNGAGSRTMEPCMIYDEHPSVDSQVPCTCFFSSTSLIQLHASVVKLPLCVIVAAVYTLVIDLTPSVLLWKKMC